MNTGAVDSIVRSVLYEGYLLYPYRPSSVKNRKRFTFGIIYPENYAAARGGVEPCSMTTECLVVAESSNAAVNVAVRFLQQLDVAASEDTQEHCVASPELKVAALSSSPHHIGFRFDDVEGIVSISAELISDGVFRARVHVMNVTPWHECDGAAHDDILSKCLISTHTVLTVRQAEFVSMIDPPPTLMEATAGCRNVSTWPVLVGREGDRDCLLSSPIILPDYPRIAPESPGDLFDGTEIDEILTLRILTLTDAEKAEIRRSDERAARMLDRVEALSPDEMRRLHGTMRNKQTSLKVGDRVWIRPRPKGDVLDVVLANRVAIVESIEQDFEDRIHVAVVVEDDPGRDLGFARQPGHRFFFSSDELELVA